jgi:hypothetical protein
MPSPLTFKAHDVLYVLSNASGPRSYYKGVCESAALALPQQACSLPIASKLTPTLTIALDMLALSLLPFLAAPALAQDTMSNYTAELASTLMGLGLTILPNVLGHINVTAQGQGILSLLATRGKNYTLFAPNDAACMFPPSVLFQCTR